MLSKTFTMGQVLWQRGTHPLPWKNIPECKERAVKLVGGLLTNPVIEVGMVRDGRDFIYVYRPVSATLWTPHTDIIEAVTGVNSEKVRWD